jgi:hypothetical protein
LNEEITALHQSHVKDIESLKKSDTKSMVRLSTIKVKQSTSTGTKSEQVKLKSPLSVCDYPEVMDKIDKILELIRKLHSEIKNEKDEKVITEKSKMINGLLESLNKLSIVSDNHQSILEMVIIYLERDY